MTEIKYQTNGSPEYLDFEDLKEKLGYRTYKPKMGSVGRALLKATKDGNHRSVGWLKHQLDEVFKKQRLAQENRKNNRNDSSKK